MSTLNKRQVPARNVHQTFSSDSSNNKKQPRTKAVLEDSKRGMDKRRIFEKGGRGDTKERTSVLSSFFVEPAVPPRGPPSSTLSQKTLDENEGTPEYKSALDSAIRRLTDTLNNSKVERNAQEDPKSPLDIEEAPPIIDTMKIGDDVILSDCDSDENSEPEIIFSNLKPYPRTDNGTVRDVRREKMEEKVRNLLKEEPMEVDEVDGNESDDSSSSSRSSTPQTPFIDLTKEEEASALDIEEEEPDLAVVAEDRRKEGNEFYKNKEYEKARGAYLKSIDACPTQVCYGNLAACYMMMLRYKDAVSASKSAVKLDSTFEKGYRRIVNCYIILGNIKEAEVWMEQTTNAFFPTDVTAASNISLIKSNRKKIDEAAADPRTALFYIGKSLEISTDDLSLLAEKAGALVKLKRFNEAKDVCRSVLSKDENMDEAWYSHAVCYFHEDNMEKANRFVLKALNLKLDNNEIYRSFYKSQKKITELRSEAAALFGNNSFVEAKSKYLEILELIKSPNLAPTNDVLAAKIEFNISLMFLRLCEYPEALVHANEAIKYDSKYVKAINHRAKIHTQMEAYEEAARDYEKCLEIDPTNPNASDTRRLLSEAKLEAKKAKRKDYYKILGVDRNAGLDQIRKAYKKKALSYHPDRHSQATDAIKKEKEKQFKEIGEALEVLSDEKKRIRYDNGEDLMESNYGGDSMHQFYQSVFQTGRMGGHFNPHNFRDGPFRSYTHRF